MLMVLLEAAYRRPLKYAGRDATNLAQDSIPASSPPADFRGFFTSVGGTVEDDGGSVGVYGVTVMAGCNSHTTMRRAEGASQGLAKLLTERIRYNRGGTSLLTSMRGG